MQNTTSNITEKLGRSEASNRITLDSVSGVFLMSIYSVIYVTSTVGNSFVLSMCFSKGRQQQRRLSVFEAVSVSSSAFFTRYIASLSIADLIFTQLTVLDVVYAIQGEWETGQVVCKLQGFLLEACYSASILTLMVISRERLRSVTALQIKSQLQRNKERKLFAIGAWVVAALLCSPLLYGYSTEITAEGKVSCSSHAWKDLGRRIYYSITVIILFLFPLVIMIKTHTKIKRAFRTQVAPNDHATASMRIKQKRAIRMLGVVTLAFFLCWTPFTLMRTLRYFGWYDGEMAWKVSQLIVISSAAVNPFIYGTYNTKFRMHLKKAFGCLCCGNSPTTVRRISTMGSFVSRPSIIQNAHVPEYYN